MKTWNSEEDDILMQCVSEHRNITAALHAAATKTGRSFAALRIRYYRIRDEYQAPSSINSEGEELLKRIASILLENKSLKEKVSQFEQMKCDYDELVAIIGRARQAVLQETEPAPRFKMDQNGNLERI